MSDVKDDKQGKAEERQLSVFKNEKHEDLTALVLCLVTVFVVLCFTKWFV